MLTVIALVAGIAVVAGGVLLFRQPASSRLPGTALATYRPGQIRSRRLGGAACFADMDVWFPGHLQTTIGLRFVGRWDQEELATAFDMLFAQTPVLSARIEGKPGAWEMVDDLAPAYALDVVDAMTWDEREAEFRSQLERQTNAPLSQRPGKEVAHITCMHASNGADHETFVVWSYSHARVDGMSIGRMVARLLENARAIREGKEAEARAQRDPMLPCVDDLLPRASLARSIAALWSVRPGAPVGYPLDSEDASAPRRARMIWKQLPASVTQTLKNRCRAQGVTITSALAAASVRQIVRRLEEAKVPVPETIPFEFNINVRELARPVVDPDLITFAFSMCRATAPTRGDLSTLARECRASMKRSDPMVAIRALALAFKVLDMRKVLTAASRDNVGRPRDVLLGISSLGETSVPDDEGPVRLASIHAGNNESFTGPTFVLVPVSVRGSLTINFLYTTPAIGDATARAFLDDVIEEVLALPDVTSS